MKTLADELFECQDIETIETIIFKLERIAHILQDSIRDEEVNELRVNAAIELLEGM